MRVACTRIAMLDRFSRRFLSVSLLAAVALSAQAQDNKCSASGRMQGEKFMANYCAAALYASQNSVTIWFSEEPISAEEAADFQTSGAVEGAKHGKQRTLVVIMFCPGGGTPVAAASAVKAMNMTTNYARSVLAGIQWTMRSPKDFKLDSLTGAIQPGGNLTGKMVGKWRKTSWDIAFDVKLPARDAAMGMDCGK